MDYRILMIYNFKMRYLYESYSCSVYLRLRRLRRRVLLIRLRKVKVQRYIGFEIMVFYRSNLLFLPDRLLLLKFLLMRYLNKSMNAKIDVEMEAPPRKVEEVEKPLNQSPNLKSGMMSSKQIQKKFTKRGSKVFAGYAANLINLKEKPQNIPSVVDGKNIRSSLAPYFKNSRGRKSFVVSNPFAFGEK